MRLVLLIIFIVLTYSINVISEGVAPPSLSRVAPWIYNPVLNENPGARRGVSSPSEDGESERITFSLGGGSGGQQAYESKRKDLEEEFSEIGNKARETIEHAHKEASRAINNSLQAFYANVDKINAFNKETSKEVGKSLEMISEDIEKKTRYDLSFSKYLKIMTDSIIREIKENSQKLWAIMEEVSNIILGRANDDKTNKEEHNILSGDIHNSEEASQSSETDINNTEFQQADEELKI